MLKTISLLLLVLLSSPARARQRACNPGETGVSVKASLHSLILCEDGIAISHYPIAIGAGGIGKRVQGDEKTPLGTYRLGRPRGSTHYKLFIPIGYPTPTQVDEGFTGSAVGIHGPPREMLWLGPATLFTDWTAGCLAVGTDSEISEVASWIARKQVNEIRIN